MNSILAFRTLLLLLLVSSITLAAKPNGEECNRDTQCYSGHCYKEYNFFFLNGICSECITDIDCIEGRGISRPGELPNAFCFASNKKQKICSPWKNGKPIDENGYPIHHITTTTRNNNNKNNNDDDGGTDWIRRFIYQNDNNDDDEEHQPAMSQVWRWDLNNQPYDDTTTNNKVEVNDTHVSIPLYTQLLAGYSRTYHVFNNEHETGIVTTVFIKNPYSVLTTKAHAGMAEKYHTLTYDGRLPTPKADRVTNIVSSRTEKEQRQAESRYKARSYGLMGAVIPTKVADSIIEAGQDKIHLQNLRTYVKTLLVQKDEEEEKTNNLWLPQFSQEAREAIELASVKSSMKSEAHCKHFEEGYGILTTKTHMIIPLNSPWITLSGAMNLSPDYHMDLNNGINIAKYDPDENVLEFHYTAYQQFRYYADPERSTYYNINNDITKINPKTAKVQSSLWVSQFSKDYPISNTIDGRSDQYYRKDPYWFQGPLSNYYRIPVDYSIYDRGNEICTKERLSDLAGKWDDAKLEQSTVQDTDNVFEDILDLHSLTTVLIDGASCSNIFTSDYGPNTTGFEILEFIAMSHFLLEFEPDVVERMATARFWDDWNEFYKK